MYFYSNFKPLESDSVQQKLLPKFKIKYLSNTVLEKIALEIEDLTSKQLFLNLNISAMDISFFLFNSEFNFLFNYMNHIQMRTLVYKTLAKFSHAIISKFGISYEV